jgi:putative MATE family efflux protein
LGKAGARRGNRRAQLIEGPIGRTLIGLAVPMWFGVISIVAFNLVDTFFVGRLGAHELAALSFTFPVVLVIGNIALGMGIGVTALISRAIGEGNGRAVRRITTDSLVLSLILVAAISVGGLFTIDPLFRALGAGEDVLPLIHEYMSIWYYGMICVVVPMVGNSAIRGTGDTRTPSMIMMVGAVVNTIFDPLLIFGIGPFPSLGIAGAAVATVIARFSTLVVSLLVLGMRERMLTRHIMPWRDMLASWRRLLFIGIPAAASRIILPIAMGMITRIISSFGTYEVAAYGVATRVEFFAFTVLFALSWAIGPFVGQNWGGGQGERVRRAIAYSVRFSVLWGLVLYGVLAAAAGAIATAFNKVDLVQGNVVLYLRIVPIGYGGFGILLIVASALNVLGRPLHAVALTVFQMFVLMVPLAFAGSRILGIYGVFGAIAMVDVIIGVVSVFLFRAVLVKLERSTRTPSNTP